MPRFAYVVLAFALAGCSGGSRVDIPPRTPGWLKRDALHAPAALKDRRARIEVVLGPHPWVIVRGRLSCPQCSRPSNAVPVQTGRVVIVRFDPRTREETDFGLCDTLQSCETSLCNGRACVAPGR